MIEEITFKFGMELKPTQHSWKSQLYKAKQYNWLIQLLNKIISPWQTAFILGHLDPNS